MEAYPKVELHTHLDGAVRHSTIIDLAKQKEIALPSYDLDTFRDHIVAKSPSSLERMLDDFAIFIPTLIGDPEALERVAYEFCADQAKSNVIYTETRYSPHLLSNTALGNPYAPKTGTYRRKGDVTPERVVQCINEGLRKGHRDYGVVVKSLLCCIINYDDWSDEVLRLCVKYKADGVVGIDQAGCNVSFGKSERDIFRRAEKMNIHRTVHAGEVGTAENVKQALQELNVERIGHGYRVLQDETIYSLLKYGNQHVEACPLSSVVTGSVSNNWDEHPIRRYLKDNINFSINTDDSTILDQNLNQEFQLCKDKLGFTDNDLLKAVCNGAKAAFCDPEERDRLLEHIKRQWLK